MLQSAAKLRNWLIKFNGVATKYMDHYCGKFALDFVDRIIKCSDMFFDLLIKGNFISISNMKYFHPAY